MIEPRIPLKDQDDSGCFNNILEKIQELKIYDDNDAMLVPLAELELSYYAQYSKTKPITDAQFQQCYNLIVQHNELRLNDFDIDELVTYMVVQKRKCVDQQLMSSNLFTALQQSSIFKHFFTSQDIHRVTKNGNDFSLDNFVFELQEDKSFTLSYKKDGETYLYNGPDVDYEFLDDFIFNDSSSSHSLYKLMSNENMCFVKTDDSKITYVYIDLKTKKESSCKL